MAAHAALHRLPRGYGGGHARRAAVAALALGHEEPHHAEPRGSRARARGEAKRTVPYGPEPMVCQECTNLYLRPHLIDSTLVPLYLLLVLE